MKLPGYVDRKARVCRHDFTLSQRLLFWLFARPINRVVSRLLGAAYCRGMIDSRGMHWLCAFFDPTQANPQINWPFAQPPRRESRTDSTLTPAGGREAVSR